MTVTTKKENAARPTTMTSISRVRPRKMECNRGKIRAREINFDVNAITTTVLKQQEGGRETGGKEVGYSQKGHTCFRARCFRTRIDLAGTSTTSSLPIRSRVDVQNEPRIRLSTTRTSWLFFAPLLLFARLAATGPRRGAC